MDTYARERHVVAIEIEAQRHVEFARDAIEDVRGNLVCNVTHLAGHVPVGSAREVIVRRRVTCVRMYNERECLKFLEDPINRRWTDVGADLLNLASHFIGGEVIVRTHQDLNDGTLGSRDALGVLAQCVEHFLTTIRVRRHESSVEPTAPANSVGVGSGGTSRHGWRK